MQLNPLRSARTRLAVVLLNDRLVVAAVSGERVETFSVTAENPAAVLREELNARQLAPRTVALGLARTAAFVKPIELPMAGGDMREMVRLNLEGHVPFAGDDVAFDWAPLPADADAGRREETLRRVLLVAAEPRVVDAALRIAEEARLRPVALTVAAHDLPALAAPIRDQRLVWAHRTGATADVLCLQGPSLVLSRAVPGGDEATMADEVRRSLAAVRWRGCDAVWISGDLDPTSPVWTGLGLPVSEPAWTPRAERGLAALDSEERSAHALALAVAMARRGRPLDLLPMSLRPRRLSRSQLVTLALAVVTAGLLVTALIVPGLREQRQLARINADIARLDPEVRAVERVVREVERKRKLLETIRGIETNAVRPLPVLRDLTELLPNDAWLTTLSLDTKGVELTGQAAAASALIPLLENSPRLERAEFASPVTRGRDKEQFRIRATWEAGGASAGGAPVATTTAPVTPSAAAPPVAAPSPAPGAPPAPGVPRRRQMPSASPPTAPSPPAVVQPAPSIQAPPSIHNPAMPARPGGQQ